MTSRSLGDRNQSKIVTLPSIEDRTKAADLARFWDATVAGQPAAPGTLDPETIAIVRLLRHYHELARHHQPELATTSPDRCARYDDFEVAGSHLSARPVDRGEWQEPSRTMTRAAVGLVAIFVVVFAVNTVVSPRSWLVTQNDPDWIPWISDDWIGAVWDGL